MFERKSYPYGVPCWVDTIQPDVEAAVAFYSGLFGWECEDQMPPDAGGNYYSAKLHGLEVAAICAKAIGQLLDFKKTGLMPGFHTDPSPESQLEASALIDAVHGDVHQAVATALEAADVREQDLQ